MSIFYKQVRIGQFGKPFTIYKFRTMCEGADKMGGPSTPADDPRLTRIGKFLRKYQIDELPQLWNILKGDISIVGPRPEWIKIGEIFEKEIPFYSQRYLVKPGITGWAQLHFPASLSVKEATEKFQYDLYYNKK